MSTPGWREGNVWCTTVTGPCTRKGRVYNDGQGNTIAGIVPGVELVYHSGFGEWAHVNDPAIVNLPLEDLKRYALTLWRMG
jgi:hypothetical protein